MPEKQREIREEIKKAEPEVKKAAEPETKKPGVPEKKELEKGKKPEPTVPEIKEPQAPKSVLKKTGFKAPEIIEPEELPKLKKVAGQVDP